MPYVPGGRWEDRPRVGCDRCVAGLWDGPVGPHLKSCGCPCVAEGCKHAASWAVQDRVDEAQRRLRERHGIVVIPHCRTHYRAIARWHELNALRRYTGVIAEDGSTSWERDLRAAHNYRWLVEIMDAGRRVTADNHGVYIDGELASVVQAREERAQAARKEAKRPARTPRLRGAR